ncbi:MAG: VOC family protein [Actinomycetota bacterium]
MAAARSIDHVVLAVGDLDDAAERLLEEHGLASVAGGRHFAWGTGNRIVPFGDDYIELLAVVDPDAAAESAVGRAVERISRDGDRWFAVCVADDDLDATAARLSLDVVTGERERPDGSLVRWRSAGFEDDPERASRLPFFIEWDGPTELHPGRTSIEHRVSATGIAWIEMGDDGHLANWLGQSDLPIRITGGSLGLRAVSLSTGDGRRIEL